MGGRREKEGEGRGRDVGGRREERKGGGERRRCGSVICGKGDDELYLNGCLPSTPGLGGVQQAG